MCGIAGIVGSILTREQEKSILCSMQHRGPDGRGVYRGTDCTLLHTRLAIIDPIGGAQPMKLSLGTKRYVISYNGELYNTQELRDDLTRLGHEFIGHSDTEVLLHSYSQWGRDVLHRLNGIYAFAIWETHSRKLFLARDRMGVKPLFYTQNDDAFLFASEIKTLLSFPGIKPYLDEEGIMEILLLGPGRTPGCGVFHNIHELEPGCCAEYEMGCLEIDRYWTLKDKPHTDSFDDTVEKVRWLINDAIKRQMVSDVPIGTFLSGGLDSSIISAVCSNNSNDPLNTFSVDYLDNDKYFIPGKFQPNSDNAYIEIMKNHINTNHQLTVLTPEELVNNLQNATKARDLPGMADVDFSLLCFSKRIRDSVKVALSGECADEIFGGYPWYRDPQIRDSDGFPWAQNSEYRASFTYFLPQKAVSYIRERYLQTIRQCDILPENNTLEKRTKEMVNLNMRWFMQTLLDRKDRMSMFHSLEVRVPFCDHRIAEYLYTVPWTYKDYMKTEKGLLRKAVEGLLPSEILWRKKSPYPKTHDPNYETMISDHLTRLLKDKNAPLFEIVNPKAIERLLDSDHTWPWYGQLMRRPQTMAYMLQIDYWLREYHVDFV